MLTVLIVNWIFAPWCPSALQTFQVWEDTALNQTTIHKFICLWCGFVQIAWSSNYGYSLIQWWITLNSIFPQNDLFNMCDILHCLGGILESAHHPSLLSVNELHSTWKPSTRTVAFTFLLSFRAFYCSQQHTFMGVLEPLPFLWTPSSEYNHLAIQSPLPFLNLQRGVDGMNNLLRILEGPSGVA